MLAMGKRLAANVAPPQVPHFGTAGLSEWSAVSPEEWERYFILSKRGADVAVEIDGKQLMDGAHADFSRVNAPSDRYPDSAALVSVRQGILG